MKKILVLLVVFCQLSLAQNRNIIAAEYFWGTIDPGDGNGTALAAEDGVFNEAVESIIATYSNNQTAVGPVVFNIRVKDANNQWGSTFKKVVFILPGATGSFREVNLTKFEYFFGNFDPGEGSGTTIIAFDGALDEAVETVFRSQVTWDVESGPILFNIRAKDSDGRWGPLFKKTVFPFGANPNAQLIAEGDSIEICQGSSVTLTYSGPFGYTPTWFNGSQENTITFVPTEEGSVTVTATLENSSYSDSINIIFKPQPTSTISPSGQILVCGSSNFSLQANTGAGLSYQWYLNGNAIANATSATHLPTAVGSYTVRVTDTSTTCSKFSEPTIFSASFAPQPIGNVNFCSSQELSVPSGSSNSYQWKKDNVNITGANSNTYIATQPGVYTCVITNGTCAFTTSTISLNPIANAPTAGAITQPTCTTATGSFQIAGYNAANTYTFTPEVIAISATGLVTANANTYTFTVTNSTGCTSLPSTNIVINPQPSAPSAPTANLAQTFNQGDTLENLVVTGTNLQWYSSLSGGTPLPLNTILVTGTTYYVSQTVNGCESNRIAITVTQALNEVSFEDDNFILFPNPAYSQLHFKSHQTIQKFRVFNTLGQLVQSDYTNSNEGIIDVSRLPLGTYFIKVNNEVTAYKIIKR